MTPREWSIGSRNVTQRKRKPNRNLKRFRNPLKLKKIAELAKLTKLDLANMFEQLRKRKEHFLKLEKELASPEVLSDREKYRLKSKEYADMKELIAEYDNYLKLEEEKASLEKMIEEEGKR